MTKNEKYKKLLEAVELIGSYTKCDCGCPGGAKGRIIGPPATTWHIANTALKNIGFKIKVYDEEDLRN
jgi:hypothetical protein